MRRSRWVLLAMSLVAAGVCVRLGFWQLDRLRQRRVRNAEAVTNLSARPLVLPLERGQSARFRRVQATGVFDFKREFVLGGRSRLGSPGVNIASPLRMSGTDSVLLALRGWVYSPDAAAIDLAAWHEPDSVTVEGYLIAFDSGSTETDTTHSGVVRRLVRGSVEQRIGAPLLPYYLLVTGGGASGDSVPRRLDAPVLDEGPHLSYAVQWFLFATIFGAGGLFVTFRKQRPSSADRPA